MNLTPHEALVVALAKEKGAPMVAVPYNGDIVKFCGECGRIVHNPDCPRGKERP